MKPQPLDLEKIEEEIIDRFNEHQPHELQEELDLIKEVLKQRIKSACEFYLRYKDKPELLVKEHPEYKKELSSNLLPLEELSYWEQLIYNEWLFKLAFKDVLEEK